LWRQKISVYLRRASAFCAAPLLLFAVPALGSGGVALDIGNDGIEDIFVTVYDMNTVPYTAVLQHERINAFMRVPILASVDAMGRANVSWSAISVDDSPWECGHEIKFGLKADALVNVHADSEC
jgi:hypothetical protein